jgi:plasmid rolling circle replication initiator protein Rep
VGDPLQSIYGFQNATPQWLQGLDNTVELGTCYRSTQAIVNAANTLTGRSTQVPAGTPQGTAVTGYAADDEIDEATHIVRQIEEYLGAGVHGYDVMILTRTHAQQKSIRRALAEEKIVGVQVKTVHEAKGQEAEAVIVTWLCEQVWNPDNNTEEVLRALYTAVTRARGILHTTWASQVLINGQVKPVDRLGLIENLPVKWSRELTTRDEIERHLTAYATLSETTKENLAERKHATDRIASLWGKAGEPKKQTSMESCGSLVTYEHYVSDENPDKSRWSLTHGTFCNLRTCPMCNWRRSVRNRLRLQAVVNEAFKQNREEHPDYNDKQHLRNPLFLTVTIPSVKGENLKTAVHDLLKTWRRMTMNPSRTPLWREGLVGYWRSLEITRNPRTGLYHPHLHVLFLATTAYYVDPTQPKHHSTLYRTHEAWGTAWTQAYNKVTGSSETKLIVDARAVQGEELEKAVAEVTKYVTKDDSLLQVGLSDAELTERLLTLETGIRGVKLVDQGGIVDHIMETADMGSLIKALIEQGEEWSKVSESDWTYMSREYYETARRDEPEPEYGDTEDEIPF